MNRAPERIAIVAARGNSEAIEFARELSAWVRDRNRIVVTEDELRSGSAADALLVLGGDGLMMHMARTFPHLPILGINFGTVGFLAMIERGDWIPVLDHVLRGEHRLQTGPTFSVDLRRSAELIEVGMAINDVVIRSGSRMIDIELYIDGTYVNTYPGDGMIVASPQGSTAYCMAAGGPILTAGVNGFAVTPLNPHSPIRSTLVVPDESSIEIVLANDRKAHLILDGQVAEDLRNDDVVCIQRGAIPFTMIVVEGMNFYEAFRSKFNYRIRPGAEPSLGDKRRHAAD